MISLPETLGSIGHLVMLYPDSPVPPGGKRGPFHRIMNHRGEV